MVSVGKLPFPWILGDQKGKKEFVAQKLAMDKAPYTKKKNPGNSAEGLFWDG